MASAMAEHEERCLHNTGVAGAKDAAAKLPLKPSVGNRSRLNAVDDHSDSSGEGSEEEGVEDEEVAEEQKEAAADVMGEVLGALGFDTAESIPAVSPSVPQATKTCPFCGDRFPATQAKDHDQRCVALLPPSLHRLQLYHCCVHCVDAGVIGTPKPASIASPQ